MMHMYDAFMLIVLVGATIFGAWKGMAWQVASLSSLIASYFVALKLSTPLAPHFGSEAPWNRYLAMLVVYLVVSMAIWVVFRLVSNLIERVKLQEFDRQVGAVIGAAKGIVFCLAITFFTVTLSVKARETVLVSRSGYYAALLMDRAHPVMPEGMHDLLEPYIHQLDGAVPEDKRMYAHDHDHEGHEHGDDDHEDETKSPRLGGLPDPADLIERVVR